MFSESLCVVWAAAADDTVAAFFFSSGKQYLCRDNNHEEKKKSNGEFIDFFARITCCWNSHCNYSNQYRYGVTVYCPVLCALLQNKQLLSLWDCNVKIVYTDETLKLFAFNQYLGCIWFNKQIECKYSCHHMFTLQLHASHLTFLLWSSAQRWWGQVPEASTSHFIFFLLHDSKMIHLRMLYTVVSTLLKCTVYWRHVTQNAVLIHTL